MRNKTNIPLPQTVDIWSLGCVFSDVATGVVLGLEGVRQYRQVRNLEIREIVTSERGNQSRRPSTQGLSPGDYFHNGREVLKCVTTWHAYLRKVLQPTDKLTARVLDFVDSRMLLSSGKDRIKAPGLCAELKDLLKQSRAEDRINVPKKIQKALLKVDHEAENHAAQQKYSEPTMKPPLHLAVPDNPEARKSRLRESRLMTTSHRKSAHSMRVSEADATSIRFESPKEDRSVFTPPKTSPPAATLVSTDPFRDTPAETERRPSHKHKSSDASQQSPLGRTRRARKPRKHEPQNVFQACEEIEKREKGNFLRKTRKDVLLTQYFRDRDIVSNSSIS